MEPLEPRQLCSVTSLLAQPEIAPLPPAISLGADFESGGNATVVGNLQTLGNVISSNKLNVQGSVIAGRTVSFNGIVNITGATIPNVNASTLSLPTVDIDDIRSEATQVIDISSIKSFNLPLNFGNGGIIYLRGFGNTIQFKGNIPVTGYGTLITDSGVLIAAGASFGTSSDPADVNLVVGGKLDINGYLGMNGSLVATGDIIEHGGSLSLTGVLVGESSLLANGSLQITGAQPAPFISYPGIPIPEPTSLGLLALGAASLLLRRRRPDRFATDCRQI